MPYCDWARQLGLSNMGMLWWPMQRAPSGARGRPTSVVEHEQSFEKFWLQATGAIAQPSQVESLCRCLAAMFGQRRLFLRMRRFDLSFVMTLCALHLCRQATKPWISRFLQPSTRLHVPIFEWHCTCSFVLHASRDCKTIHRKHIVPSVFDLLLHNRLNFWRISFYSEI